MSIVPSGSLFYCDIRYHVQFCTILRSSHRISVFSFCKSCRVFHSQLKNELSNFGPEFFDEIEDLKFRCHEATEQCRLYEEQLLKLSKQFGVSVNIPTKRWRYATQFPYSWHCFLIVLFLRYYSGTYGCCYTQRESCIWKELAVMMLMAASFRVLYCFISKLLLILAMVNGCVITVPSVGSLSRAPLTPYVTCSA